MHSDPKQHSIWAQIGPNWDPFGNAAWDCWLILFMFVFLWNWSYESPFHKATKQNKIVHRSIDICCSIQVPYKHPRMAMGAVLAADESFQWKNK